ncbi:MAG: dephospho-CoA kinase [Solirubrobacteraceae bacterium]|nr:dephospho-CoA kinase [Patulibacter sp.]
MGAAARGALPFVGLTGGLGAGKSTALGLLGELGAATISADAIVHELYRGEPLASLVTERWGEGVVDSTGAIDRQAIAKHVFADPDERTWLEGVIWPLVGQRIHEFRQAANRLAGAPAEGDAPMPAAGATPDVPRVAVVETPLLFEAGMGALYDVTIAVIAPEAVRTERAAARGHAAVSERDARQLSQDEKAAQADHAVVNDGSVDQLRDRLAAVLDGIAPQA